MGLKSGPSLTEHVHPDLASSAKLVSRDATLCGWVLKRDAGSARWMKGGTGRDQDTLKGCGEIDTSGGGRSER